MLRGMVCPLLAGVGVHINKTCHGACALCAAFLACSAVTPQGKPQNGHALSFGGRLLQDSESLAVAGVKDMDSVVLESDVCALDVMLPSGKRLSVLAKKGDRFARVREAVAAMEGVPLATLGHFVVRSVAGEPSRISESRTVGDAEWLARGQQLELLTHELPAWPALPRAVRPSAGARPQQARIEPGLAGSLSLSLPRRCRCLLPSAALTRTGPHPRTLVHWGC